MANMEVVDNLYTHSKLRNFKRNVTEVNVNFLGKQIDKMISDSLDFAIAYSESFEEDVYKDFGVNGIYELSRLADLDSVQQEIFGSLGVDELISKTMRTATQNFSKKDLEHKVRNQLEGTLQETVETINATYTREIEKNFKNLLEPGKIVTTASPGLSYVLDCVSRGRKVDLITLGRLDSQFSSIEEDVELAVSGEISEHARDYVNYVEEEMARGLARKDIRSRRKETGFVLSPNKIKTSIGKGGRAPAISKQAYHESIISTVDMLRNELGGSEEETLSKMLYSMVNISHFITSGSIEDKKGLTVIKMGYADFPEFQDYLLTMQKAAIYWMIGPVIDEITDLTKMPAIMVIGNKFIPLSTILIRLKAKIENGDFNNGKVVNLTGAEPIPFWGAKVDVMPKLPPPKPPTYPQPLLGIGGSVGTSIAQTAMVNANFAFTIQRLIRG